MRPPHFSSVNPSLITGAPLYSIAVAYLRSYKMSKVRIDRINEEISHAVSEILPTVKDPRVQDAGMISITHVDTAGDLSVSKIYISVFPLAGKEVNARELKAGLKSCSGYIRKELSLRVKLRLSPEPVFILDDSLDRGAKVINLINHTMKED